MIKKKNIGKRMQVITNILFAFNIILIIIAVAYIICSLESTELYNYVYMFSNITTGRTVCIAAVIAAGLLEILIAFIIKTFFEGFGRLVENSEYILEKLNDINKEY